MKRTLVTLASTLVFLVACNNPTPTPPTPPHPPTPPQPAPVQEYEIQWMNGDGKVLSKSTVKEGETPVFDYWWNPTKKSTNTMKYTWDGTWDPIPTPAMGNKKYYPNFTESRYQCKVDFCNWNGKGIKSEYIALGSTPVPPTNPSRPDDDRHSYTFTGWDKPITKVYDDVVYYAQYTPTTERYLVTYRDYDGTILDEKFTPIGETYAYDGPDPTGHDYEDESIDVFAGWDKTITPVTNADQSYMATYNKVAITDTTFTVAHDGSATALVINVDNGGRSFVVDWGDGNEETFTGTQATHTYASTSPATYNAKILKSKTLASIAFDWNMGAGVSKIISMSLSNSIDLIDDNAFRNLSSLTSITIPDRVRKIGDRAFYYCESLANVQLSKSLTSIGEYAFYCCPITSIYIPEYVNDIDGTSFVEGNGTASVSALTSIDVDPDNVTYTSENKNVVLRKEDGLLVLGCVNSVLSENVKTLGDHSFAYCPAVSFTLPPSVEVIEDFCFYDAHSYTSIKIPNSVTRIGDRSMWRWNDGDGYTIDMTELDHVPEAVDYPFMRYTEKLSIKVSASMYISFTNAPIWSEFKNNFVPV